RQLSLTSVEHGRPVRKRRFAKLDLPNLRRALVELGTPMHQRSLAVREGGFARFELRPRALDVLLCFLERTRLRREPLLFGAQIRSRRRDRRLGALERSCGELRLEGCARLLASCKRFLPLSQRLLACVQARGAGSEL